MSYQLTKVCNKCKEEFPLTDEYFHRRSSVTSGFNGRCKICRGNSYYLTRKPIQSIERLLTERFTDLKTRVKRRRVKYNVELDFDLQYLLELWNKQEGKCAVSGIDMTYVLYNGHNNTNVSIDRIDSSKGYLKSNIQLVCCIINRIKLDLTMDDLLFYCEQILKKNELSITL